MQSNGVAVNNLPLLLLKVDREMTSYMGERQQKREREREREVSSWGKRANIFIGKHKLQSFLYTPDL